MWLHIRGVGEWTNRLYSYFEKEQERLHNGEVSASVPGFSKTVDAATPQKDFLSKNLSRLSHTPMLKSSSFENPRPVDFNNSLFNANSEDSLHNENELEKKENPFVFDAAAPPIRPPRQSPGTSKLATETYPPPASTTPKFERQNSEYTAIKKIQASLQRTFSRKGASTQHQNDGNTNDGFVGDDSGDLDYKPGRKLTPDKKLNMLLFKNKAPLEKSLSMPDMENRLKKRERLMAFVELKY